jgi:hypothetical protein
MDDVLSWTRTVLNTTPARWLQLAESFRQSCLAQPPPKGEWSAVECLYTWWIPSAGSSRSAPAPAGRQISPHTTRTARGPDRTPPRQSGG